jgi:hypothetical protein
MATLAPSTATATAKATGLEAFPVLRRLPLRRGATALVLSVLTAVLAPMLTRPALAQDFTRHAAGSTKTLDHAIWDKLLKAYVKPAPDGINRVDFAGFKKSGHAELKRYVAALEAVDFTTLDRPEQFAFWANLYNAKTIDVVLDKYPVKSIKDISLGGGLKTLVTGGPWQAKIVKVNDIAMSLDDIENTAMRPVFKDPRVHYSVNCASLGCPNLLTEAFTGAKLEGQLEAAARAFVNHPRGFEVVNGKVKASSIYTWFQADFGPNAAAVLDHARKYAEPALKQKLEGITAISDYAYDWQLIDAKGGV